MKKLTERIRQAKTWQERAELAANNTPGTPFDNVFKRARLATEIPSLSDQIFRWLGEGLAGVIARGESQQLHDMAEALNIWKKHKPNPDPVLVTLFSLTGMFPDGWTQRWLTQNPKTGQLRKNNLKPLALYYFRDVRDNVAMRDIRENLERNYPKELGIKNDPITGKPKMSDDQWNTFRRKAQRYAKIFGIELDSAAGKPAKILRHNRGKKVR